MPVHEPTITTKKITHYVLECCGVVLYNGPDALKAEAFLGRLRSRSKPDGKDTDLSTPEKPESDGQAS